LPVKVLMKDKIMIQQGQGRSEGEKDVALKGLPWAGKGSNIFVGLDSFVAPGKTNLLMRIVQ